MARTNSKAPPAGMVSIREAAKLLGMSPFTIYKLRSAKKLPVEIRSVGGQMMMDRTAVQGWARSRRKAGKKGRRRGPGRPPKAATRRRGRRGRRARRVVVTVAARRGRPSRAGSLALPAAGAVSSDFWSRLLRFVRDRGARIALQTDGTRYALVGA